MTIKVPRELVLATMDGGQLDYLTWDVLLSCMVLGKENLFVIDLRGVGKRAL
jgi:hypothetical protein